MFREIFTRCGSAVKRMLSRNGEMLQALPSLAGSGICEHALGVQETRASDSAG